MTERASEACSFRSFQRKGIANHENSVLGASGTIGQRIVFEALERGHEVKALVRNPENVSLTNSRLSVALVDIFNPESIFQAIVDADVVVNATGPAGSDPQSFFTNSTNAVIHALEKSEGKRLLVVGGAGTLEVAPGVKLVETAEFPEELRSLARAQGNTLTQYRSSNINWTFFSPAAIIVPGKRTAKYRLGKDQLVANDQGESYISAEDYAVVLLDEIEHPQFLNQRFTAASLEK
ncbi:MAG: NAD(P)-dependent oxidoreductase [Ktedonobacteraceae bacterium]|nr:NAD(P)-dependent oxidoreductase [Ktedonobacteraceae bacterium]